MTIKQVPALADIPAGLRYLLEAKSYSQRIVHQLEKCSDEHNLCTGCCVVTECAEVYGKLLNKWEAYVVKRKHQI